MSFWPYGEMAEELADAVLTGSDTAIELAKKIKDEAAKAKEQDKILSRAANAIDDYHYEHAKEMLEQARAIGCIDEPEIVRLESLLYFERDTTVLDRVVQECAKDKDE